MSKKYHELLSNIQPDIRKELNSILIIDGLNTFLRNFARINHINPDGHHIGVPHRISKISGLCYSCM
jgi:hypothetical protein